MNQGERIGYIDIARGIGILLVVMGHNDFAQISPLAYQFIYAFHMPLFFFLSGIFFNPGLSFKELLRHRFNGLLKPYLFTLALIFFFGLSFSNIGLLPALTRLVKSLYGSGRYLDWGQLWFLPELFVVSLLGWGFYRLAKVLRLGWLRWLLLGLMLVLGVLGIRLFWPLQFSLLGRTVSLYGLPLSLDLALVCGFFFVLGREVFQWDAALLFGSGFVLLVSGGLLLGLLIFFRQAIDLDVRQFDSLPINALEALLGICFTLALSRQLERVGWLSRGLQYIGRSSLVILLFEIPMQEFWSNKISALTDYFPLAYGVGFVAGVAGPLIINELFIRPNPLIRRWFGQK